MKQKYKGGKCMNTEIIDIIENPDTNYLNNFIKNIFDSISIKYKNNFLEDEKISIFCHYTDSDFDLLCDGYNFYIEVFYSLCGLGEGLIEKTYMAFDDENDAIMFTTLIYENFKEYFGESGYDISDNESGKSFSSGIANFDFEKNCGVNFVCHDIEPSVFKNKVKKIGNYKYSNRSK